MERKRAMPWAAFTRGQVQREAKEAGEGRAQEQGDGEVEEEDNAEDRDGEEDEHQTDNDEVPSGAGPEIQPPAAATTMTRGQHSRLRKQQTNGLPTKFTSLEVTTATAIRGKDLSGGNGTGVAGQGKEQLAAAAGRRLGKQLNPAAAKPSEEPVERAAGTEANQGKQMRHRCQLHIDNKAGAGTATNVKAGRGRGMKLLRGATVVAAEKQDEQSMEGEDAVRSDDGSGGGGPPYGGLGQVQVVPQLELDDAIANDNYDVGDCDLGKLGDSAQLQQQEEHEEGNVDGCEEKRDGGCTTSAKTGKVAAKKMVAKGKTVKLEAPPSRRRRGLARG